MSYLIAPSMFFSCFNFCFEVRDVRDVFVFFLRITSPYHTHFYEDLDGLIDVLHQVFMG